MPTKKGKSKPAKARKTTNKMRRSRAVGKVGASKRTAGPKKKSASTRASTTKRSAGRLKRTEAGSVWIGSSPAPVARPTEERGDRKVGDVGSGSVRIL
jgi:hypothetical protein